MKYKERKKAQRKLNRYLKQLNKAVEKDDLLQGRYFIRQLKSDWIEFDDFSGGQLRVFLEFKDKKSGAIEKDFFSIGTWKYYYLGYVSIFSKLNEFINVTELLERGIKGESDGKIN